MCSVIRTTAECCLHASLERSKCRLGICKLLLLHKLKGNLLAVVVCAVVVCEVVVYQVVVCAMVVCAVVRADNLKLTKMRTDSRGHD